MKLGAFSISLAVKDINASKAFYETLGFSVFGGDLEQNYLIMKNESTLVGLFQGMFENNMLTFNPGWDQDAKTLKTFDDVRDIQKHLKNNTIKLENEADEATSGPASFVVLDSDGNAILIDQHI
ncbi:Glyoxalase/bleomycin resistance protein/dioxygenase precursor [Winogradskyella psychrotolerans RS-3]|uniref:Glyoxalase/bleomycin resistance protein/dioxygenase n=1 Tax=Winogradskyella psychrotolerans RS-3 TaxID=641526 RepID=S7VRN2_9FLAO|nr:VOC family protein [Winogradskyella psychrotolerans]EPR72062.1 Glyoxalase/bleomycin resistance protein/dioxygenase precursor [Winogradskyella psychrotolerans RS-3]